MKAEGRPVPYRDLHVYLMSGEVFEAEERDLGDAVGPCRIERGLVKRIGLLTGVAPGFRI